MKVQVTEWAMVKPVAEDIPKAEPSLAHLRIAKPSIHRGEYKKQARV